MLRLKKNLLTISPWSCTSCATSKNISRTSVMLFSSLMNSSCLSCEDIVDDINLQLCKVPPHATFGVGNDNEESNIQILEEFCLFHASDLELSPSVPAVHFWCSAKTKGPLSNISNFKVTYRVMMVGWRHHLIRAGINWPWIKCLYEKTIVTMCSLGPKN